MFGFICKENDCEWWVRRKEKGKPKVVITREQNFRITEYETDYVLSHYCECPKEVKKIAKELKKLEE